MIFIQESKSRELTEAQKLSIWDGTHKWLESPAEGQSGGLCISWDSTIFEPNKATISKHWIYIRGRLHKGDFSSQENHNFINIYAPQKPREKVKIWEELQQIIDDNHDEAFCLAGDLNCIWRKKKLLIVSTGKLIPSPSNAS